MTSNPNYDPATDRTRHPAVIKRLVVLEPDWNHIPPALQIELLKNGELGRLCHGADYGSEAQPPAKPGDRPVHDYCQIPEAIDPRFPEASTHHRPAGWIIVDAGECYAADAPGMQKYDEIWVFKCSWDPIPETENPWIPFKRLESSLSLLSTAQH